MERGNITKIAAVAVMAMIGGSMLATLYFQDIVPSGDLIANRYVADVGENIQFQVINAHPNTVRFLVDFHDTSPPLDLQGVYSFAHAFLFEGIYNITVVMVSTAPALNQAGLHYMGSDIRSKEYYLGLNAWEMVNLVNKQGEASPASLWPVFREADWWNLLEWEKKTYFP